MLKLPNGASSCSLSSFSSGVYFLRMKSNDVVITFRIMKD
ncbi:MAG: T9SS type A sorting domain-containing protein [Flavobacteriales bacterium]